MRYNKKGGRVHTSAPLETKGTSLIQYVLSIAQKKEFVKMTEKGKAWVRLPLSVLADERLTPYEAVVLSILIDRNSESTQMSVSKIAALSGISERKAKDSLKTLEKTGYIAIHHTGRESVYTLLDQILPPKKRNWKKVDTDSAKKESNEDEYEKLWNAF